MAVVGKRVRVMGPAQVYHRFRGRVAGRIRMDRVVHGRELELGPLASGQAPPPHCAPGAARLWTREGTEPPESREGDLSPSLVAVGCPTTQDLETPQEWGNSMDPGEGKETSWVTQKVGTLRFRRRMELRAGRPSPPERGPCPGSTKRTGVTRRPPQPQEGVEFCTSMDLELASPQSVLSEADSWAVDNVEWRQGEDPAKVSGTREGLVPSAPVSLPAPGSGAADGDGAAEVAAQAARSLELLISQPGGEEPMAWGDSRGPDEEEEDDSKEKWTLAQSTRRKRASSGGGGCPRGRKAPPFLETSNYYGRLAGESEMDTDTDMETETVSPMTPIAESISISVGFDSDLLSQSGEMAYEPLPCVPDGAPGELWLHLA
ncbi:hypothetical protein AAFF_G00418900 [Aldrovandia affinis]|uniref:Uncharacterized protein n=1 Tax=Aldrovandia affinis TaxID=143900 RepID=A0AAD7SA72_9TELE|nr:hypothetical protein AAFF_G00418900 [Aldrovandia affinis]